jgi:hypothetical protein
MARKRLEFDQCWSINQATGCHEWIKGLDGRGYGSFYIRHGLQVRAHRYSFESSIGPIPEGLKGVRPYALNRKLTDEQVIEIRRLRIVEHWKHADIARKFGVSDTVSCKIALGQIWNEL